ncbi:MAG: hypothetical protein RIT25_422 [Planctomycetota bacterium]|jgi:hypothetical protein
MPSASLRLLGIVLPSLLLVACAVQAPQDPARAGDARGPREAAGHERGSGTWGERRIVQAAVLPAAWMQFEQDDPSGSGEVIKTRTEGWGWMGRFALGNTNQGLGLCYQGFSLDGDEGDIDLHSFYLDADIRVPIREVSGMYAVAGAGLGAAFDSPGGFDPDWSVDAAAYLRFAVGVEVSKGWTVDVGGGVAGFGHPGDTEAFGSFVMLGSTLSF